MSVVASIVVDFGALKTEGYMVAQLDAEKNFDKTSFLQGEDVFFQVYSDSNYSVETTSGTVVKQETKKETDTISEIVLFPETQKTTVQNLIKDGTFSISWYGNDGGTIIKSGSAEISIPIKKLVVGKFEYKSEYDLWKLSPPNLMPENYAILILIKAV